MKRSARIFAVLASTFTSLFACGSALAQNSRGEVFGGTVEFASTSHNFGDVVADSGELSYTFNFKNTGTKPIAIFSVNTSCGCTTVKWTKEPIAPGKSGKITAVYSNDEGPYPFDKTLMAYFSGIQKPVILHLRGTAHEKQRTIDEIYTFRSAGGLAFGSSGLKCGNVAQGTSHTESVNVANLGNKPLSVEFRNVDSRLKLKLSQNPIPARS
ncbi:MAG: DUF1573 domain-containing protein, partial [Bacteroidales bacterium]|nr:DUF1573 domain-containing protein [Bacteroidales bacterium]